MKNKKFEIIIYFPVNKHVSSKRKIVKSGTTLKEFLDDIKFKDLNSMEGVSFGVFGKIRDLDYNLQEFDRVEVLHNASVDPKKSRSLRAKKNYKS